MRILITGANGFVGKNLVSTLENIKNGKDTRHNVIIEEIYKFDKESTDNELELYCKNCDFVFNLAGVNRPLNNEEFMQGNYCFANLLLDKLKKYNNKCPVMLASSIQATLEGRFANSDYGKSKLAGEKLLFAYGKETGAKVLIYRFANLFGKWCKPNYNSVIATFCHNIANDLEITVNDPNVELELVYIDDLINELIEALNGNEHRCEYDGLKSKLQEHGRYCCVPVSHFVKLGEVVELLEKFKMQSITLNMPEIPNNSFAKKLYSTYLSYLPIEKTKFALKMNVDKRGSFTELLKTTSCGQFSVNISKPGITKGNHWHHSKWEIFIVVKGHALIQERNIITNEMFEFEVSGDKIEAVQMLPGYTHNIVNLSDSEELVTLMWANESFDSLNPDTYYLEV